MEQSASVKIIRDFFAVLVTTLFMFPIFWWALTSIKPHDAVFNKDSVIVFDFVPTAINYIVTLLGRSRADLAIEQGIGMGVAGSGAFDSRQTIFDSLLISLGATIVSVSIAIIAHEIQRA
jgi:multiple sugar transport system permease protein